MSKRVGVKGPVEDINPDDEWDEQDRKENRYNRIRNRVPTGHPHLAKKLLQPDEFDETSASEQLVNSSGGEEDEEGEAPAKACDKAHKKRHRSDKHKSASKGRGAAAEGRGVAIESRTDSRGAPVEGRSGESKSRSCKKERKHHHLEGGGDEEHKHRHKKHHHHHHHREHQPQEAVSASEDTSDSDVSIKVVVEQKPGKKSSRKSSSKKAAKTEGIQFGEKRVIDSDEESWEERHQERFSRIRARVPTGHPGLAKKVAQLREVVEA